MNAASPTRRRDILRALASFSSPARVSAVARAAAVHDSNARGTVRDLLADGHVERCGTASAGNDQRPIRITQAGRDWLAAHDTGATVPPGASIDRARRLALHPTHMLARDGERRDCGRYEACLHGAAMRVEYSGGASCPARCAWETPPERVSATEYAASGRDNGEAAMYAGW